MRGLSIQIAKKWAVWDTVEQRACYIYLEVVLLPSENQQPEKKKEDSLLGQETSLQDPREPSPR